MSILPEDLANECSGFVFDLASKDAYKTYMTGFIPSSVRRRFPGNGSVAPHVKKLLLRTRQNSSTFEFAYQARIAVERIRFAIRQIDQVATNHPVLKEVGMQLLGALDRLEMAERHFQEHSRFDANRSERFNFLMNGTRKLEIGPNKTHRE